MQPLAYLAIRCCISWIQFLERKDRAFVSSTSIVLTTGPVHCWSLVYALFIAVHLRTYRHIGHHQYEEQLPLWVWWIETLTVLSTVVWWIASCALAFTRIVSDDMLGLPVSRYDAYTPKFLRVVLSRQFRDWLSIAHMSSGIGLFLCLLFLACALPLMPGEIVTSELCLIFVAAIHALVLLAIALRSALSLGDKGPAEAALLCAAEEAATLGPQLCVLLTLANVPGSSSRFERAAFMAVAASWGASLAACGRQPPKCVGMVAAPSLTELGVCLAVDVASSITLFLCFPPLNAWPMWLLGVLLVLIGFLLTYNDLRSPLVELLEPIMPFRNDAGMRLPAPVRDGLRGLSRGVAVLCAMVVAWDISVHIHSGSAPRTEPAVEEFTNSRHDFSELHDEDYPDKWSADSRMLLRWQASAEFPGEVRALELAAEALQLNVDKLSVDHSLHHRRILVFRFLGPIERGPPHIAVYERWQEFLSAPSGVLASLVEKAFPPYLDAGLCLSLPPLPPQANSSNPEGGEAEHPSLFQTHQILKSVEGVEERLAYAEACWEWRRHEFAEDDLYAGGEYDGPMLEGADEADGDEVYTDEQVEQMKTGESEPAAEESPPPPAA
mmetsp:Transcript_82722/g.246745  ORF Transcript_82722/g.246745 Transcript_82722/m.246745 type:complete len:609 (+) Transcript_82722:50-1876(+)